YKEMAQWRRANPVRPVERALRPRACHGWSLCRSILSDLSKVEWMSVGSRPMPGAKCLQLIILHSRKGNRQVIPQGVEVLRHSEIAGFRARGQGVPAPRFTTGLLV